MKQLLQFRLRELEFWKGITVRFEETRKKLKKLVSFYVELRIVVLEDWPWLSSVVRR